MRSGRFLAGVLVTAGLLLGPGPGFGTPAAAQTAPVVAAPSPWYAGDTHEMIQLCQVGGVWPPDRTPADVYDEMLQKDLRVSNVLVLVTGNTSCLDFLAQYAPMVTGSEHPVTLADPDYALQFGCEVVGGSDPGCLYPDWGHVAGLGISRADYYLDADYPAPNLDFFRSQPGAIAGYPHVAWPLGTSVPGSFPPVDRKLTRLHPLLAPTDVALGRVDFLGTADIGNTARVVTPHPWWGLWYKLLSAGQRVSIAGGTVAQCYAALRSLDARTWVRLEAEPLTYPAWIEGLAAGRVSISDGPSDFLSLRVGGKQTGEELRLPGPSFVVVEATLKCAEPRTTTIEIVQDGVVIASEDVSLTQPGSTTFRAALPVAESGWIAARTLPKAHTGAVYTIVDGKPITDPATAEYFRAFNLYVLAALDLGKALCAACAQPACLPCTELQTWVGSSEAQIRADLAEGARVFRAIRDYELPLPDAARYGTSTPGCRGPMGIGLVDEQPRGSVVLTCFNAPPEASGVLVIGAAPLSPPIPFRGADLLVSPTPVPMLQPVRANQGGFAEVRLAVPAIPVAIDTYAQFVWRNPATCPGSGAWSASDGLWARIPRRVYTGK